MKFAVSFIFVLLFSLSVFAQTKAAEVVVPTTYLRKSPNASADKVETVQQGARVILEKSESTNGWYYVSAITGKKGWINANTITSFQTEKIETVTESDPSPKPLAQQSSNQKTPKPTTIPPTITPTPNLTPTPTTPNEDEEVVRIESEEVNLSVRVLDENNRPVNNLTKAQFKVFENGEQQDITSFGTAEVPTNYALVVDNSRSLRTQLQKIIEAGKILINTNRPSDESTVVRFVDRDKIEVMRDFTTDKSLLNNALDNLFIEGGQTAIIDAIYLTAKRVDQYRKSTEKDDFRRRALIVISDGDDRSSSFSEQQLIDLLRRSEVQIYAIGFTGSLNNQPEMNETQSRQEKARAFLTRIAAETGGKVYFPNSIDELSNIASDISGELRTQYLLTYAPTNSGSSESFRNINVNVADGANNEKRRAITRTGRTATTATAPPQTSKPKSAPRKN